MHTINFFIIAVLSIGLSTVAQANSSYTNGYELLKHCKVAVQGPDFKDTTSVAHGFWCLGYIAGFAESHLISSIRAKNLQKTNFDQSQYGILYCSPINTTYTQMAKVVVRYLETHRNKLNEPAAVLTAKALQQAYPCGQ